MLELAGKHIKTVTITQFNLFKKLEEELYMSSRNMEDNFLKAQIKLLHLKLYGFKIHWMGLTAD